MNKKLSLPLSDFLNTRHSPKGLTRLEEQKGIHASAMNNNEMKHAMDNKNNNKSNVIHTGYCLFCKNKQFYKEIEREKGKAKFVKL